MALLRSLLEDTDLITYFALFPDDATQWREQLSRAPVWSDQVYRQGIKRFRLTEVWRKLKEKGIEPLGQRDHPVLSAAVHASPWGARFFGHVPPNEPDRLYFSLSPVFDPAAAFSVGLVLQETLPRPIHAFLVSCVTARAPKSEYRSIQARYTALMPLWEQRMKLDSWFRNAMTDAEERVAGGESPETVEKDVMARFQEIYGASDEEYK